MFVHLRGVNNLTLPPPLPPRFGRAACAAAQTGIFDEVGDLTIKEIGRNGVCKIK
jgi:hypothetical protein